MKLRWVLPFFMLFCFSSVYPQSLMDSLVFSSIDDQDYDGLMRLIQTNRVNITKVFTENHETPLHYAAFLGDITAVRILIDAGVNVDATTPQNYTALHLAAQQGYTDIVNLLLQYKASQTVQNQDGFMPVHLAASFGRLDVVKLLTENSGIVDKKGIHSVTPLQLAAQNGHNDIVLYLLSLGADPNFSAEGSHGRALHFAIHGDHSDTVSILLEHGAKVNATNDTGDSPLVWNGYIGNVQTAQILLKAGADKSIITHRFKYNALHTASIRGKYRLIEYFLKNKIFTGNEVSGSGSVALHYAALYGHIDAMRVLIPVTSDINIRDIYGQTPLHYAVSNNKVSAVRLLLQAGAQTNIANNDGETPINLAKKLKNLRIIQSLQP